MTQSGTKAPASASDLIAINPVLLSESFVTCSRRSGSSAPSLSLARCQLMNGSTLRIASDGVDTSAVTAWSVVQVPGAVVQRGTATFASTDLILNVAISAVDRTRSFALVTTSSNQSGVDNDERSNAMIELSTDTNVQLSRGSIGAEATVDFQVIQFPVTNVQSGVVTLSLGTASQSASLPTTVDLSRSFVVHSTLIGQDVDGAEAVYMVGSSLSSNDITFTRKASDEVVQVSWFAVELPAPSSVKTQELLSASPHDQLVFDFSDDSYTENMISFHSVEIDSGTLRTSLNAASFTSELSGGKVRLERAVSDGSQIQIRSTVVDIVIPSGG